MNSPVPKRRRRRMAPEPAPPAAGCESSIFDDILFFHILALLPVKCLARLQSVGKLWRSTITSAPFARRHLELSRARPPLTVLMPRNYLADQAKMRSRFVNIYGFQVGHQSELIAKLIFQKNLSPDGIPMFRMPLHCDGMILIPCVTGETFLCNPATRELVKLPPGSRSVFLDHSVAFGFDPWRGTYKVARHFIRSYVETPQVNAFREYSCGHEILTLGDGEEAWKWKATVDPPYPIKARTPVCLPGFFYWSALHSASHGKVSSDVILRFSLQDETFTVHPNPPCRGFLSDNDVLSELGGKLCYVHSVWPLEVAIWLGEDGPTLDWSLRCRVSLPLPMALRVYPCASAEPDKIFLSVDACHLFRCDLSDGSLEKIANMAQDVLYESGDGRKFTTGAHPIAHYMVPFVESLLRIAPV